MFLHEMAYAHAHVTSILSTVPTIVTKNVTPYDGKTVPDLKSIEYASVLKSSGNIL